MKNFLSIVLLVFSTHAFANEDEIALKLTAYIEKSCRSVKLDFKKGGFTMACDTVPVVANEVNSIRLGKQEDLKKIPPYKWFEIAQRSVAVTSLVLKDSESIHEVPVKMTGGLVERTGKSEVHSENYYRDDHLKKFVEALKTKKETRLQYTIDQSLNVEELSMLQEDDAIFHKKGTFKDSNRRFFDLSDETITNDLFTKSYKILNFYYRKISTTEKPESKEKILEDDGTYSYVEMYASK